MAWNYNTANERIDKLMQSVPDITIQNFDTRFGLILEDSRKAGKPVPSGNSALINISRRQAVLVNGVHIYANLANYNEFRLEHGKDTEGAHKKALNFLHLHYQATDRLIEAFGAQRVDFHGGRMHCVIVDPIEDEEQRIIKALEFSSRLQSFLNDANNKIADGGYEANLRIGIDSGPCIAINSGKGSEDEPLFLGGPANYAAKLAVGDKPGIYLSDRIRTILKYSPAKTLAEERSMELGRTDLETVLSASANSPGSILSGFDSFDTQSTRLITEWQHHDTILESSTGGASSFKFYTPNLPLAKIKFSELSPSRTARLKMVNLFGDIDNYTKYIDECQANGNVEEAVRALHVIRGELANVLKFDFGGRKIRFIGDCIHGVTANAGIDDNIDNSKSVKEAIGCSAAMVSSFKLIQEKLPNIESLGLASGIDLGLTPISRIGIRGERSVRVASSTAAICSQIAQESCDDAPFECALGDSAYEALSQSDKVNFDDQKITNLDYDSFGTLFGTINTFNTVKAHNPTETEPVKVKAHSKFN